MRRAEATQQGSGRRNRFTQSDILRAVKAVQLAGLTVFEVNASDRGVRVITSPPIGDTVDAANPWDEVLSDA